MTPFNHLTIDGADSAISTVIVMDIMSVHNWRWALNFQRMLSPIKIYFKIIPLNLKWVICIRFYNSSIENMPENVKSHKDFISEYLLKFAVSDFC